MAVSFRAGIRLMNRRLVVAPEGISQFRGNRKLAEILMADLKEAEILPTGKMIYTYGLDVVAFVSHSGKRITHYCEDASEVLHAAQEARGESEIPVQRKDRKQKKLNALLFALFLLVMVLLAWSYITRAEMMRHLVTGLLFVGMGLSAILFKWGSRYRGSGQRKWEIVGGAFMILAGCAFLFNIVMWHFSDWTHKGMRYVCTRRYVKAEEAFKEAKEAGESGPELSYGLGLLSFFQKDYDRAINRFSGLLEMDPSYNDARYQISRAYACMGNEEKARICLEQYLAQGGGCCDSQARKALKDFR